LQITLPEPALVLLVGPSGSGKSTFAAAFFGTSEIVSSDALRGMLTNDPADQDASAEAFRLLALLLNGRLKRRLTTVVDATNLRAADRRRYGQLAARYGIPVVAVAFDLPLDVYSAHNTQRPVRTVKPEVIADQAERMRLTLADLTDENYAALFVITSADEMHGLSLVRGAGA